MFVRRQVKSWLVLGRVVTNVGTSSFQYQRWYVKNDYLKRLADELEPGPCINASGGKRTHAAIATELGVRVGHRGY